MSIRIERYFEHEISSEGHASIEALRNSCFPEHQEARSYGKQFPHFRFLAFSGSQLVGHLGVDHRAMRFGDEVYAVFGVIDVCVVEGRRNCGIGSRLLDELEKCARAGEVDLLVLLARNHGLYSNSGFHTLDAKCFWLKIHQHRNLGVGEEEIADELMIKLISLDVIPKGPVDFLGYLF